MALWSSSSPMQSAPLSSQQQGQILYQYLVLAEQQFYWVQLLGILLLESFTHCGPCTVNLGSYNIWKLMLDTTSHWIWTLPLKSFIDQGSSSWSQCNIIVWCILFMVLKPNCDGIWVAIIKMLTWDIESAFASKLLYAKCIIVFHIFLGYLLRLLFMVYVLATPVACFMACCNHLILLYHILFLWVSTLNFLLSSSELLI